MDAIATDGGEMAARARTHTHTVHTHNTYTYTYKCVSGAPRVWGRRERERARCSGRNGTRRWSRTPRAVRDAARTDGQATSRAKVAAAGQLLVLVLTQDGAERPVGGDEAAVQPQPVAARADDRDRPAYFHAVGLLESVAQQQQLDQRHEQAGDVEALSLDFADRALHFLDGHAARLHKLVPTA